MSRKKLPLKYSIKQFKEAVKSSHSIRQVAIKLNLNTTGQTYRTFHRLVKEYKIDTAHFTGQRCNKGKTFPHLQRPIQDYLSNKHNIRSGPLKRKLIKANLLKNICSMCLITEWKNKPITLHLDHIDGNSTNNNLSNLRILCPNCHSQTSTYAGKNIGKATWA